MRKTVATVLAVIFVVAICAFGFTGCVAKAPSKAVTNLEKEGYEAIKTDGIDDDIEYRVYAVKKGTSIEDLENNVTVLYFKDAKKAKYYYKSMKLSKEHYYKLAKLEHDAGEISDNKWEKIKEEYQTYKIGISGKVVWFGHKDAVKAAG